MREITRFALMLFLLSSGSMICTLGIIEFDDIKLILGIIQMATMSYAISSAVFRMNQTHCQRKITDVFE